MPRKSKHYSPTHKNKTKEFHKSTTNFERFLVTARIPYILKCSAEHSANTSELFILCYIG